MFIKSFTLLFSLLLLVSCSESVSKKTNPVVIRSKNLEYSRSTDLDSWQKVFTLAQTTKQKTDVIRSMSRVKNPALVPLFKILAKNESRDTVLTQLFLAAGLNGSKEAEDFLLNLSLSSYPLKVQRSIIRALAFCCTEKSVTFLAENFDRVPLRSDILYTLAICAKKGFVENTTIQMIKNQFKTIDSSFAYLLYNNRSFADVPYLVTHLDSAQSALAEKYLLKALYSLHQKKPDFFNEIITPDSVLISAASSSLLSLLRDSGQTWPNTFYALHLAGALLDTNYVDFVKPFLTHENPHIKLAAYSALTKLDAKHAELFLLNQLTTSKNNDIFRGELIKILASVNPSVAYRFIMENLDKGNKYFKGILLEGLSNIGSRYAVQSLRQFLLVDDDYLRNKAFEALNAIGKIRSKDTDLLLKSSAVSSFSTAMEWLNKHRRKKPLAFLLDQFKTFSFIDGFEAQRQIVRSLELFYPELSSAAFDSIYQHASIYQIKQRLIRQYPRFADKYPAPKSVSFELPNYLRTDSVLTYTTNPLVEVETEKGTFVIELFPREAPLTVKNFLSLAQKGFYDNLTFHRVVPDFVIQGGDPLGDGWGGPGYVIPSEDNLLPYKRGSVGIATSGYDTGGCQFFICHSEQPHLNGNYTLFGQVIENIKIVDLIEPGDKILGIKPITQRSP